MKTSEKHDSFRGFDFIVKTTEPNGYVSDTTIVYIHGQAASTQHRKARIICEMAMKLGNRFCWYELAGHANNMEKYDQTDIFLWIEQLKYLLSKINGRVILVGACLGGVIGLLAAEGFNDKVRGVIGISSADIYWRQKLTAQQLEELATNGYTMHCLVGQQIPFKLTEKFIASTDAIHEKETIELKCPVHLYLGLQDTFVKLEETMALKEKIISPEVVIKLIGSGSHGMRDYTSMKEVMLSLASMQE